MHTIGFVISHKNNELRRALLPQDMKNIKNKEALYFEEGYGKELGISDNEYLSVGANVVKRSEVLDSDIIVDVKLGDADYLDILPSGKVLIGWAHAVQNIPFTNSVISNRQTVVAWEEMFEDGRYVFYKNREIAGEAAILHAYRYLGKMPYETNVAVLGNGQTAKGALRVLNGLGARVDVYGRKSEDLFKKNMYGYDVIVNCVLWDTNRVDRIIYKEDLLKFKPGTMIIDVSCDPNLEIETTVATTIDDPVYKVDNVIHYAVDNTPAMFPHTVTKVLSREFSRFIDELVTMNWSEVVKNAIVIDQGHIIHEDIARFREVRNLFIEPPIGEL